MIPWFWFLLKKLGELLLSSVKTCKYIQKKKSAEIKRKTGQLVRKCFSYFSAFFLYLISTNSSRKVFKKRKKKKKEKSISQLEKNNLLTCTSGPSYL